jgi:hypothetical protein
MSIKERNGELRKVAWTVVVRECTWLTRVNAEREIERER